MELIPILNTVWTGLWGRFKHRFPFMSVFFKFKIGTSYSASQSLGDMGCGLLSCHTLGTNWDADPLNCTFVNVKYCHRNPWTFSQNCSKRQVRVFRSACRPYKPQWGAARPGRAVRPEGGGTPFPDCAHQCGIGKALSGKQTHLFCSFPSTAICSRQGRNRAELHSLPRVTKRGPGFGARHFLAEAALV